MTEGKAGLGSVEELGSVWDRFRAGGVVACPRDGAPMALAVDAAAGAYRFVCTSCGTASPWFESGPNGLKIKTGLGGTTATLGED